MTSFLNAVFILPQVAA